MNDIKLLILDDEVGIRQEIGEFLQATGFTVFEAGDAASAFAILQNNPVDIAIVDIRLPGMGGLEVLGEIKRSFPSTAVIMISGHGDMDTVIEALRGGAEDYIKKPFLMREVMRAIEKTRKFVDMHHMLTARTEEEANPTRGLWAKIGSPFIFGSSVMQNLHGQIARVSVSDPTTVLITGESGTGKELVARSIHLMSQRKDQPFETVNCSSVPEELFESEFFGYKKGAFTGAHADRAGWFEAANGGTLFLDEVGDLKLSLQAKLLRIMDDQSVTRLGTTASRKVDVRVIAATNHDLKAMVADQQFRLDLYHRLNAFTIEIPPLRERMDDLPLLLEYFIRYFAGRLNKEIKAVSKNLLNVIERYDFPGNVRELKHMVERAVILCDGHELRLEHFDHLLEKLREDRPHVPSSTHINLDLNQYEREAIEKALRETNHNKSKAARLLGISRQALDRRMEKFGIR